MAKAVAKKPKTEVSTDVIDMHADAGKGSEGADKDSYAIPFLTVVQGLSPQVGVVEGATPGKFINTITEEIFDAVSVIPCAFQRKFLRWAPREKGGGFKGAYSPIEVEGEQLEGMHKDAKTGQLMIEEDLLRDTRIHYILMLNAKGAWKPAVLSLSSTQIKKSKRLMSLIQGLELEDKDGNAYNPASYSHMYKLTTVQETNEKGSWWGLAMELEGKITSAKVYADARAFSEEANSGTVKTEEPQPESREGF